MNKKQIHNIEVVIADLGLANYIRKSRHNRPQGDTNFTSPEGLFKKLSGKAFYGTDLYAVGCLLYQVFYEKMPQWQVVGYPKMAKSPKARAQRLYRLIEQCTASRRTELNAKSHRVKLAPKEEFESMILQMVNPNPKKRLKVKQARKKLEETMKRISGKISHFEVSFLDFPYESFQLCA